MTTMQDIRQAAAEREETLTKEESLAKALAESEAAAAKLHDKEVYKLFGIWILPFIRLHKIPVFKRVWLYLFLMAAYTALVDFVADKDFPTRIVKDASTAACGGVILGLLLVFRTNAAYDRWWEGRKLWGQLVNDSRNLCLKVRSIRALKEPEKTKVGEMIISFAYALKHHLRDSSPSAELPGIGQIPFMESKHMPVYVSGKLYDLIQGWHQDQKIDGFLLLQLDRHARSLMDVCGACERIRNSPLAVSYRAFMRQGIVLNLLALPWFVAPDMNIWWSMPLILIGAYFLIGLELIAEDIEDPFGYDGDDLPLDNICSGIRTSVSDILNVREERKYTTSVEMPQLDPLKAKTLL